MRPVQRVAGPVSPNDAIEALILSDGEVMTMVEVSCRYFQRGFTDSVTEDDSIAVIGVCTHPRIKRDNPDCAACVIPRLAQRQLCPGISQQFDQIREEFRYRCTIHRVKVLDPFGQCKALRACPLDQEGLAS